MPLQRNEIKTKGIQETGGIKMGPIAKEIKRVYDKWKKNQKSKNYKICNKNPFLSNNSWMYNYLFPEIFLISNEFIRQEYKCDNQDFTFEQYKKFHFTYFNNSLRFFPCWICSEDQILRIMAETEII